MTADPVTVTEFVGRLRALGEVPFQARYGRAALVGLAMVGSLDEGRRGRRSGTIGSAMPSLAAMEASAALVGRVWPVVKSPSGPPGGAIVVGRTANADLVVNEYSVSDPHCELRHEPGRLVISDLDSLNGTFVNDKKLPPRSRVPIADGALVTLGRFRFRFHTAPGFARLIAATRDALAARDGDGGHHSAARPVLRRA